MKKIFLIASFCAFSLVSQSQCEEIGKIMGEHAINNQPNESWKVNKKLDENGRVIHYDSTYTWFYSNKGQQPDFNWFEKNNSTNSLFDDNVFSSMGRIRLQQFWKDTVLNHSIPNIFNKDPSWLTPLSINPILKQMDSIHQYFLKQHFRERTIPSSKTNHEIKKT